jgi:hypothetical protein
LKHVSFLDVSFSTGFGMFKRRRRQVRRGEKPFFTPSFLEQGEKKVCCHAPVCTQFFPLWLTSPKGQNFAKSFMIELCLAVVPEQQHGSIFAVTNLKRREFSKAQTSSHSGNGLQRGPGEGTTRPIRMLKAYTNKPHSRVSHKQASSKSTCSS